MPDIRYSTLLTSTSVDLKSKSITSNNTLDNGMDESKMRGAGLHFEIAKSTHETTGNPHQPTKAQHTTVELLPMAAPSPHQNTSLMHLPLDLLFMIFDYAACRDHLEDSDYLVRLKYTRSPGYRLVVSQPALLMVSKDLRCALTYHFYSTCSFHAKIKTRPLLQSAARGLRLKEIDDNLPYPLRLNTISLTLEMDTLTEVGFDQSLLVELGMKSFVDHQAMRLNPKDEFKNVDLRWRLVWIGDDRRLPRFDGDDLNEHLRLLLQDIHRLAATSASLGKHNLQEFGSFLERRLKEEGRSGEPAYQIREFLRYLP